MAQGGTLSPEQVEALARPFIYMAEAIVEYYKDPEHERDYQAYFLERYGRPAPEWDRIGDIGNG